MRILVGVILAAGAMLQEGGKSALEAEPTGWIDLMPGKDLAGWKRVPVRGKAEKAVWTFDEEKKVLLCDGVGTFIEMLLHEEMRGDGIFHVEWRFRKGDEKTVYNGGVYIRTAMDGTIWHQAQVAHGPKPPVVGDLIMVTPVDGKPKRVDIVQKGVSRANPLGEWNTYEVTCRGRSISLWVNGGVTAEIKEAALEKGHIGLQSEFAFIEFRSLKYKPLR